MIDILTILVIFLIWGAVFRLMRSQWQWGWYVWAQVVNVLSDLLGLFVIWYPIVRSAWHDTPSTFQPGRQIDIWNNPIIRRWQGNWEDGNSGRYALIWSNGQRVPFMPDATPRVRAFLWWCRNRSWPVAKIWFAWDRGTVKKGTWLGGRREYKFGWAQQISGNVMVCSF